MKCLFTLLVVVVASKQVSEQVGCFDMSLLAHQNDICPIDHSEAATTINSGNFDNLANHELCISGHLPPFWEVEYSFD